MKTEKYYFSNFGNVIGKAKKKWMDKKWKEEEKIQLLDLKAFLFINNRSQCNYGRKKLIRVVLVTLPLLCDIVRTGIPGVFLLCGFGGGLNSPSLPLVFFGKKKKILRASPFFFFFFFFLAHVTHGVCSDDGCLCVREILFTLFKPLWFYCLVKTSCANWWFQYCVNFWKK